MKTIKEKTKELQKEWIGAKYTITEFSKATGVSWV